MYSVTYHVRGQVECKKVNSIDRPSKRNFECETRRVMSVETNVVWSWDLVNVLRAISYEIINLLSEYVKKVSRHILQEANFFGERLKRERKREEVWQCQIRKKVIHQSCELLECDSLVKSRRERLSKSKGALDKYKWASLWLYLLSARRGWDSGPKYEYSSLSMWERKGRRVAARRAISFIHMKEHKLNSQNLRNVKKKRRKR